LRIKKLSYGYKDSIKLPITHKRVQIVAAAATLARLPKEFNPDISYLSSFRQRYNETQTQKNARGALVRPALRQCAKQPIVK
jgi:hypothetical protein